MYFDTFFDPLGPAEGTIFVFVDPLDDAVEVESVFALADDGYAVVAWELALGTGGLEGLLANGALTVVLYVPHPRSHSVPTQHFHFHYKYYYQSLLQVSST